MARTPISVLRNDARKTLDDKKVVQLHMNCFIPGEAADRAVQILSGLTTDIVYQTTGCHGQSRDTCIVRTADVFVFGYDDSVYGELLFDEKRTDNLKWRVTNLGQTIYARENFEIGYVFDQKTKDFFDENLQEQGINGHTCTINLNEFDFERGGWKTFAERISEKCDSKRNTRIHFWEMLRYGPTTNSAIHDKIIVEEGGIPFLGHSVKKQTPDWSKMVIC